MKPVQTNTHEQSPDPFQDSYSKTTFGFWVFLLTDFVLFGTLFACYAVLRNSTVGGLTGDDIIHLPRGLVQSLLMLTAAFTVGLGGAFAHRKDAKRTIILYGLTFALGLLFVILQVGDLQRILQMGHWRDSAYLSIFFTVVGTFDVHMLFALIWIPVLLFPVFREGISQVSLRRLVCLKMFWQFLNIIWMLTFSFLYLLGVK